MRFIEKLRKAVRETESLLCVGLDPVPDRLPKTIQSSYSSVPKQVFHFCREVIESTLPFACAYKPNLAFFEALGPDGMDVFREVRAQIPYSRIVIADAKRGDIGHTAQRYRSAFFDGYDVDAITLSPLMGFETLKTFLDDGERGIYALTLTSNPGSEDFFKKPFDGYPMMSHYIAHHLADLQKNSNGHAGMVVGATQASLLKEVVAEHPRGSLLIPGLGAQGGSVSDLIEALEDHPGVPVVSVSRSIIYAGSGDEWDVRVTEAAQRYKEMLHPLTVKYI